MTQSRFCSPEESFKALAEALRNAGYNVKITTGPVYDFAYVTGMNIEGGFCTPSYGDNDPPYWYIDGRFAADNSDCFDKWSKCPLIVTLPEDEQGIAYILEHLRYLATEEGRQWSASYGYIDDPRLPREDRGQ